jgi:hypothetical protein
MLDQHDRVSESSYVTEPFVTVVEDRAGNSPLRFDDTELTKHSGWRNIEFEFVCIRIKKL